MLNLCITFDHELFFGENFLSEEEILINPTYEIIHIMDTYGVKATFFTDVCSIDRHKTLGINKYPELMEKQILYLIGKGHDVQLHIHSNWYKSEFTGGKWKFDKDSYRIHYYGFNKKLNGRISANSIIKSGKEYLEKLIKPMDADYKCIAYRAGGYCIQPEGELFKILLKNGIKIDSSVVRGAHSESNPLQYSFLNMPRDLNWWIDPQCGIGINSKKSPNSIFEVPIGTISRKPDKWLISKQNIPFKNIEKRGTYISLDSPKDVPSITTNILKRIKGAWNNPLILSLDDYKAETLYKMVNVYLKHNDCSKGNYYVAILGHPKLFEKERLDNLDRFVKLIKESIPSVTFVTMQDIYKLIP